MSGPFGERTMTDGAFDALVDAYYIDHPGGGNLHIVLDEGGVKNDHLYLCLGYAMGDGDEVGVVIAMEMLRMGEDDRTAYHTYMDQRALARRQGKPDPRPDEVHFSSTLPVISG